MPARSDSELLTLLSLRLKGFVDSGEAAQLAGIEQSEADEFLGAAAAADLVVYRDGRISGWQLKPEGRLRGEQLLAAQLDQTGSRDAIGEAYDRFLEINYRFLSTCTDWQVRVVAGEQQLNDHCDPEYDDAVIAALASIDELVQPIAATLTAALDRFASYGPRFAERLSRVRAGDTDWFTKPMIDSYHTVWFELHENLLATLGIERATESKQG
ncbi:MAG: hypothetical protein V3V01_01895 [Acidimicrobiales bacterium]